LFLGTLTTGTGPHAGSGEHVRRLHLLSMQQMTQLHADSALLLTGLILATVFTVRLTATPSAVRRRSLWLVAAVLSQVVIGYTQYFLGLPASVVEIHVAGATVLWTVALWMHLGYTTPTVRPAHTPPVPSEQRVAADRGRVVDAASRYAPAPARVPAHSAAVPTHAASRGTGPGDR
jgi:cytochrome c oxidase assembly protein subunit 15